MREKKAHIQTEERIIENANPTSPKAMAWDNPFGVFPGSKKDLHKKQRESEDSTSRNRTESTDRPPTSTSIRTTDRSHQSGGGRGSLEEAPRPHTSHGAAPRRKPVEQPQSSFNQPLGPLDDMPLRKKPPPLHDQARTGMNHMQEQLPHSATVGSFGLPTRPAPQRSASGPDPYQQQQPDLSNGAYDSPPQLPGHSMGQTQQAERQIVPQNARNQYEYDNSQSSYAPKNMPRQASNGSDRNHYPQQERSRDVSYRGIDQKPVNRPESITPNFEAMSPYAAENIESTVTHQQQPVGATSNLPTIYRKPTYGDMSSKPPPARPGLIDTAQQPQPERVSSPLDNFDFGLPQRGNTPHLRASSDEQRRQMYNQSAPPQQPTQRSQFPPRNGSRPDLRQQAPGFTHPYNQPPVPRQEHIEQPHQRYNDYQAPRGGSRPPPQTYAEDIYDQYGDESDPYRRPLNRTHTEPVNSQAGAPLDHYNHGYDQRMQRLPPDPITRDPYQRQPQRPPPGQMPQDAYTRGRQEYSQQPYDAGFDQYAQAPPRPRTANSSRPPPQQYPNQPLPMPQGPPQGLPRADRNHPIPIRPGLMTPHSAPVPATSPAPMQMNRPPPPQAGPPQQAILPPPRQNAGPTPAPAKQPVTANELNEYRHAFKDKPNDDQLGLKFAKRLAEAAVVLADDGGRADAKTTAKNRERYINDAYRIVKRLVANGSPDATFYLADCYGSGSLGLEPNAKEAFHLYTSAAKTGHPQAAYRVAVCCELGQEEGGGTRRDHAKAVQFYKRAATLGDGPAMFKMGMILLKGLLGQQPNRREGISWLKRAAERADEENPHALHELAMLYETAQSTDVLIRDEAYAFTLFTQAANLGYKYSQHRLGSAYEYGTLGCQIDPRQSISWYSRAAQQGEHQAEFALSGWYLTGSEPLLAQSDNEAYLWARKAAQSGLAKAEYAMGYYTEVGIGCPSNLDEARKWYFRAAGKFLILEHEVQLTIRSTI